MTRATPEYRYLVGTTPKAHPWSTHFLMTEPGVILLTRLDNSKVLVNFETVKFVESTPDTLVTYVNGDSMIVRESMDEIERRMIDYKVKILSQLSRTDQKP